MYRNADKFLVATSVSEKEWTVEAAIPLNELSAPASSPILVWVERIRAVFEEQRQWKQRREQERAERAAYFRHRWRRREDPPYWGWEESARPITLPSYR